MKDLLLFFCQKVQTRLGKWFKRSKLFRGGVTFFYLAPCTFGTGITKTGLHYLNMNLDRAVEFNLRHINWYYLWKNAFLKIVQRPFNPQANQQGRMQPYKLLMLVSWWLEWPFHNFRYSLFFCFYNHRWSKKRPFFINVFSLSGGVVLLWAGGPGPPQYFAQTKVKIGFETPNIWC